MTEQTKIDHVALVLHANVPSPTMKHILLTIAVLSNENGICRPSITRLEILTSLNRRTVTRNLKKLEEDGWLFIDRKGTPTQKETNFYQLNPFKLRIDKVSFVRRSGKSITKKVEAQNPQPGGTVPPNTNTAAPRPTAAPQAQAGGSGADNKVITNDSYLEVERLFNEPDSTHHITEEAEPLDQLIGSTEPKETTTTPEAAKNPYEDRDYITQAEHDEAIANGFYPWDLPDVREEPEELNVESSLS